MQKKRGYRAVIFGVTLVFGLMFAIVIMADNAQANVFEDIAITFNNKLFGGENLEVAEFFLSACILVSIAIVLAIAEVNVAGMSLTLIMLIAFFTLIGWLEIYIIILAVIVTGAFFSKRITEAFTKGGD